MIDKLQLSKTKNFFEGEAVKKKFNEMLGKKAPQFITSVLQIVASNDLLSKADPVSIYQSASVAATLDLPLNNNLGFAYIIPYNTKQKDGSFKTIAQFQLGYKGFIQLAQRSGQFKTISAAPIYEGQIADDDPLKGFQFDFKAKKSEKIIGFAAYFSLINGFEKTLYMSIEDLKAHGLRYSKTFSNAKTKAFSKWETDFEAMATKTVLKLLLSKFAPLSIEMQKAIVFDQGEVIDAESMDVTYPDNEQPEIDKEAERITLMLQDAKNLKELESVVDQVDGELTDGQMDLFHSKRKEFENVK